MIREHGPVAWVRLPSPARAVDCMSTLHTVMHAAGRSALGAGAPDEADGPLRDILRDRLALLRPHLEGVETLTVIPSSDMAGVPIDALLDEDGHTIDRYAITHAPSATIYAWLTRGRTDRPTSRPATALLLGDPPFHPSHLETSDEDETTTRRRHASRAVLGDLPRLQGSRREIERVRAHFTETTVLLGRDASEQSLRRLATEDALRRYEVIHLATHALVNADAPELSALALSQIDLPDPVEAALHGEHVYRGHVTGRDVVRDWTLDAELVTLSACETGTGRRVRGEGLVGFVHAFLEAGAHAVLVSLWTVDDRAATLLMDRFYGNWLGEPGMSKVGALREAKRWLRDHVDEAGRRPFAHPYYWSSFVLFGDPS